MRLRAAVVVSILLLALSGAAVSAAEGQVFGKGVGGPEVVKISELLANPEAYLGKTVRVDGLVTDVCPKAGCWIDLAGDREPQTMRIKVDDGVIVFPVEAKGKRAVAEGVFAKIELTADEAVARAKHHAEEKGETFDPATAKDLPTVIYQIRGSGAVIR